MRAVTISLLLLALAAPALAGVDVDLSAAVRIGDEADLYFGISSRYFEREPRVVRHWGERYRDPDDLAVALFIAGRSRCSLDAVYSSRGGGADWWQVGVHCGVPVDAWFVPVARDPGPPYGKAYGYWKKHKHGRGMRLTDVDVRNLVAVRMVHEYYGVPVEIAMQWRASGRSVRTLVTEEYRNRHGHGHSASAGHGASGKGKAKGKSKAKKPVDAP